MRGVLPLEGGNRCPRIAFHSSPRKSFNIPGGTSRPKSTRRDWKNSYHLLPGDDGRFNLARALVGSESICVTILEAKVRLVYSYPKRVTLVLGYPSIYEAGDHVPQILKHKPIGFECLDEFLINNVKKKGMPQQDDLSVLLEGKGWLVEFGAGTTEEAEEQARRGDASAGRRTLSSDHPAYDPYSHHRGARFGLWNTAVHGPEPEMTSHETVCLLNPSDQDAQVEITIYFSERDLIGTYRLTVPARRTKHVRFNDLKEPAPVPRGTDHASIWLVSLMDYDLGYIDRRKKPAKPLRAKSATYVYGRFCYLCLRNG